MFAVTVGTTESYDEQSEEFVEVGGFTLEFEHSLVSLSKWESKHQKPFMSQDNRTDEETLDYIRDMLLTENPPENWLGYLRQKDVEALGEYINSSQTATTIREIKKQQASKEVVTSELIYYWMVAATVPFECQHWHLNRLLTLLRVCEAKNQDPSKNKMSKSELAARNRELNAQRRKQLGTKG